MKLHNKTDKNRTTNEKSFFCFNDQSKIQILPIIFAPVYNQEDKIKKFLKNTIIMSLDDYLFQVNSFIEIRTYLDEIE